MPYSNLKYFRVPFFSWGSAQRKYSAAAQRYAQRLGVTRSGKGYTQRQDIRSSRHAVRRICYT